MPCTKGKARGGGGREMSREGADSTPAKMLSGETRRKDLERSQKAFLSSLL